MSNLALSAAIIIGLGLPGLLVYYRYLVAAQRWEISGTNEFATPQAIAFSILVSLVFHCVWITGISMSDYQVDYAMLMAFLVDDHLQDRSVDDTFVYGITTYLSTQCVGAWFFGSAMAFVAEKVGWSQHLALRSNGAVWHRLLRFPSDDRAAKFEGPILTITYTENARTNLYRGKMYEYQLDSAGKLVRLVLEGVLIRRMPDDLRELDDDEDYLNWREVVGEKFVINCERVNQIEVDYVWLEETPPGSDPAA